MTYKETNADDSAYGYGFCTADGSSVMHESGLTKREYFAAMALQGLLANDWAEYRSKDEGCGMISAAAVNYADALIEQLNKSGNP